MTDGRTDEPDFDDPAYDAIRDLLASAKVETPIPADVAARLDATLADLTGAASPAPPVPEEDEPVVVPLRRRARWAPRLLAAAAVVTVVGAGAVGLQQVLGDGSDSRTASADSAAKSDAGTAAIPPSVPVPRAPAPDPAESLDGTQRLLRAGAGVPVLTSTDFARQAAGIDFSRDSLTGLDSSLGTTNGKSFSSGRPQSGSARTPAGAGATTADSLAAEAARGCAGPQIRGTSSYPIVLDDQPAVLVVHPADAGTRLVEAWSCDGSRVLAFTTVPA